MAFHLINVSIDTPDSLIVKASVSTSDNDQESLTELILEKICGMENLVPETADTEGDENSGFKKATSLDHFIIPDNCTSVFIGPGISFNLNIFIEEEFYSSGWTSLFSRPPELKFNFLKF